MLSTAAAIRLKDPSDWVTLAHDWAFPVHVKPVAFWTSRIVPTTMIIDWINVAKKMCLRVYKAFPKGYLKL